MNIFKKNRKAKDDEDALGALTGNEGQHFAKASRALTRRKKKQEVEEKPVFDLSSALPDNNDFRTSLLMPNLSARFSMLREQDNPNTKVGKASDDSVLFPKRVSRLNLFNNDNYLTDIAEVESIYSTFRPPFADDDRKGSMSDGYASDDGGSVMNRSRPGDGNNLFGGRQKLYKITTGSNIGLTGGKHMYESDVAMSAFQQFRLKEKEQRELDERTDRSSLPTTELEESDFARSSLTEFKLNRGTQSSTNSDPSNRPTSTAATSVISESPVTHYHNNMPINKVKELDANSSAESIGFATSPKFRTVKVDGASSKRLSQSRSAVNLRENYTRPSPVVASNVLRAISPPLSAASQLLDFGLKDTSKPIATLPGFQTASPTPCFDVDQDDTLASNVRPNDRGKATAMGLFNKPARHYDEAQFSQRQLQMHEGRNSPMSNSSRSASRASPDSARPGRPSYTSTTSVPHEDAHTPQIPPIPDHPASPTSNKRSSASSTGRRAISRPRAKSSASNKEVSIKARVESLIKRQNAELAALEAAELGFSRSHSDEAAEVTSPSKSTAKETFFDNSDDSEDDFSEHRPSARSTHSHVPPVSTDVHPALREGLQDFNFGTEEHQPSYPRDSDLSRISKARHSTEKSRQSAHESMLSVENLEAPPIPNAGLGLSGLIRTHLRQDSDKSSMLPPPSPALPNEGSRGSTASTTRTVTESVKSDPFEFDSDRVNVRQPARSPQVLPTPTTAMSEKAQQILGIATAIRDANANAEHTSQLGFSHQPDTNVGNALSSAVNEPSHQRNESTETQREQQRFEEELAARRRRIDENLQNVQERSRSRSPVGERNGGNISHGFSLPRFPGRSNTGDRLEPQGGNKAMKMLGMSSGPREQPSPRPHAEPRFQDSERPRHGPRPPTAQDYDRPNGRQTPTSRPPYRPGPGYERPPPPRSTTPSSKPGGRARSNSGAAGRSASRSRHVPEFDPSTMPGAFPNSPQIRGSPPHNYVQRSESPAHGRQYERSGSSAAGQYPDRAGYLTSKPLGVPEMGSGFTPRPSPRPSPNPVADLHQPTMMPMSPPSSALPSPNPAAAGYTNGHFTPTNIPGRATPSGTRKRSITKGMISEPTFVSSTSSVPLVYLPRNGGPSIEPVLAPPVPIMNPRRRGYTVEEQQSSGLGPHPVVRPNAPQAMQSPMSPDFQVNSSQIPVQPRQRNRLRKSSSEGGDMAAHARQQALMVEMAREKDRSPNVAVFPNRSATSLAVSREGGMF